MINITIDKNGKSSPNTINIGNQWENRDEELVFSFPEEFKDFNKYVIAYIKNKKTKEEIRQIFPITNDTFVVSSGVTRYAGSWHLYTLCKESPLDLDSDTVDIRAKNGERISISDSINAIISPNDIGDDVFQNFPMDENIKLIYDELFALKLEFEKADAVREENELARKHEEELRVQAENARVQAEANRVEAENNRTNAEGVRVQSETNRVSAEQSRVNAENSRVENERNRTIAETSRTDAERLRVIAENERVTAETARQEAENRRDSAIDKNTSSISELKSDLVDESNKITTDHFDIFGDSDFIEHEGLLVGYNTTTYDASISTESEKYMVYRTLEIAIKNLASLKIKCPSETNIGMTFLATDLTATMPSKTSDTSATPSQINGNYSKKYISHVSSDEYYLVNTKALFEDGYKKMYVCYLATERPYIYCEKNFVPKWLYDFSKDISELRKIVEGGDTEESETIYEVMNPSIYNMIYDKNTSTVLQDGKTYILKVTLTENVSNGNISLNSAGSSSSKFKVFAESEALASGEHTYSFTFDGQTYNQVYLRLFLDGASSKCSTFEIIDPNVSVKTRLDKKMDYVFASVNMFNSIGGIGDSFMAGSTMHSNNAWTKEKEHSWIAIMAKRAGISWSNYGVPGANTRTYLSGVEGEIGMNAVLNADANDFYYFALGINDVGMLGLDYLGTIADITPTYENNPDTFFGNYARIIEKTMAHAPNAKFAMVMPANKSGNYPAFREAIEQIANHYSIPCIDLLDDLAFSSKTYLTMSGSHPTLAGYSAMALAHERLFSKMVEKNVEYFRYATVG